MGNLIAGVVELIIGIITSVQQMTTTHDSVVSALQGSTLISTHITGPELLTVLNTSMDKFNRIGWLIAWITQVVFWTTIMPKTPITNVWLHKVAVGLFFVCEVTTDIWYSIATGVPLGGIFSFVFTLGVGGIAGSILYCLAMATGSILILMDGIHRLESVYHQLSKSKASAPAAKGS
jgi:hypothetical protein